jgi:hypothetical protein
MGERKRFCADRYHAMMAELRADPKRTFRLPGEPGFKDCAPGEPWDRCGGCDQCLFMQWSAAIHDTVWVDEERL